MANNTSNTSSTNAELISNVLGLFDWDPERAASNATDVVDEMAPYAFKSPDQWQNEGKEEFIARRDADLKRHKLKLLRQGGTGCRAAYVIGVKDYFMSGEYMNSTLVKINGGESSPSDWFERIMEDLGNDMVMSYAQKSLFKSTITVVVPEVERFGYELKNDVFASLIDESGEVSIGNTARRAASLISRARAAGGVTKNHAELIYKAFTGDEKDRKALELATQSGKTPLDKGGRIPAQCSIEADGTVRYTIVVHGDNKKAQQIIEQIFDVKPYGNAEIGAPADGDPE